MGYISSLSALGTVCLLLLAASSPGVANAQAQDVSIETQILMNKAAIKDLGKSVKDLGKKVDGLSQQLQQATDVPRVASAPVDGAALQDLQAQLKSLGAQIDTIRNAQKDLPAQLELHETQAAALRTVQKGLSVQVEKNSRLQVWVELLGLTTLLAAGAVVLCLWRLRAPRALVPEPPGNSKTVDEMVDPILNREAPFPNTPEGAPGRPRGKKAPSPPPHQKIAKLLARLHQEAPRLAEGFGDSSLQERFLGEFGAHPMRALLDRLRTYSEQGPLPLREHWLGPDLVTTLDALARFYSEAVEEGRQGRAAAKGLARKLRAWLYDRFSPACQAEGWFAIDPVDPYKTEFDPHIHHAAADRDVEGAKGKIIAIKAIGRRDPKSGAVVHRAEVIVGR